MAVYPCDKRLAVYLRPQIEDEHTRLQSVAGAMD